MNTRPAQPSRPTPPALGLVTAWLLAAPCAATTLAAERCDAMAADARASCLAAAKAGKT